MARVQTKNEHRIINFYLTTIVIEKTIKQKPNEKNKQHISKHRQGETK